MRARRENNVGADDETDKTGSTLEGGAVTVQMAAATRVPGEDAGEGAVHADGEARHSEHRAEERRSTCLLRSSAGELSDLASLQYRLLATGYCKLKLYGQKLHTDDWSCRLWSSPALERGSSDF